MVPKAVPDRKVLPAFQIDRQKEHPAGMSIVPGDQAHVHHGRTRDPATSIAFSTPEPSAGRLFRPLLDFCRNVDHDSGRPKSSTIPILMLVPPRSTPKKRRTGLAGGNKLSLLAHLRLVFSQK